MCMVEIMCPVEKCQRLGRLLEDCSFLAVQVNMKEKVISDMHSACNNPVIGYQDFINRYSVLLHLRFHQQVFSSLTYMQLEQATNFTSRFLPLRQKKSLCQTIHMKMCFTCMLKFCMRTHFETDQREKATRNQSVWHKICY